MRNPFDRARSEAKAVAASREIDNPYLAARREWNERNGDYIAQAHNSRVLAIVFAFTTVVSVCTSVYLATRSKFIPFVVKVDTLGQAVAVGAVEQAPTTDPRVVSAQLARWIYDIRSVYIDAGAEHQLIHECYKMLAAKSAAATKANEAFSLVSPFQRAERESVSVEVVSVLPISGATWRIEWRETSRSRSGDRPVTETWQADVTVVIDPPRDPATILANPMGVFITDYSWTKRI